MNCEWVRLTTLFFWRSYLPLCDILLKAHVHIHTITRYCPPTLEASCLWPHLIISGLQVLVYQFGGFNWIQRGVLLDHNTIQLARLTSRFSAKSGMQACVSTVWSSLPVSGFFLNLPRQTDEVRTFKSRVSAQMSFFKIDYRTSLSFLPFMHFNIVDPAILLLVKNFEVCFQLHVRRLSLLLLHYLPPPTRFWTWWWYE